MEMEAESLYYFNSLTRTERKKLEEEILSHPEKFCNDVKTYHLKRMLIDVGLLGQGSDGKGGEILCTTRAGQMFLKARRQ